MRDVDIKKLIDWLGRDGAIAGLEDSDITVAEFREIALKNNLNYDKKARRTDIIVDLINRDSTRIDKAIEELLAMDYHNLRSYLVERKVSRTELLGMLKKFDIRHINDPKIKLLDFVARELSDMGMYQRVAKGGKAIHK